MPGYAHPKWYYQFVENLCVYPQAENQFHAPCKDIQTYFGYFRHAWLYTTKMIISTCRRLRCLSTCQKQSSSFTSSLRYYILKNPAILLADSILVRNWRPWVLPDMGLVLNINSNISFHFKLFWRKTNYKIFQKPRFWDHLGLFCSNLDKNEFSRKKGICQFLNVPFIYHHTKNQKKLMWKMLNSRMDRQTSGRTDRKL